MSIVVNPTSFNNFILTSIPTLSVLATNSYLVPERTVQMNDIARTNMSKVTTGFFTRKDIVVTVGIAANTKALAEAAMDTLFAQLQGLEKELIIVEAGSPRRYLATYADCVMRVSGGAYLEFDLVFTCSDRFGYSLQYEKLLDATGRTLYNYTDSFTVNGNALTQVPIITVVLSALSGSTTNAVTLTNNATGQRITVSRAWTAGDSLVVDCHDRTVKVNGTSVDFTGSFLEYAPGTGYLNYQDDFASRTLALSVYYNRRFI